MYASLEFEQMPVTVAPDLSALSSSNAGAIAENRTGFPNCGGHIALKRRAVNAVSAKTGYLRHFPRLAGLSDF
jgi:hypothetical protein